MSPHQQPPSIDELRAQVSLMLDSLPAETPIAAIVFFEVNPGKEGRFVENANTLTEDTRRLPGCNAFAFHKTLKPGSPSTAIEYLIYEDWQTRDLFRTQWNSHHLQRFQHTVGDLIVAPPDLRFYYGWRDCRNLQTERPSADGSSHGSFRNNYSSIFSFPIVMSFFSLQQMANILEPAKTSRALESVTRVAEAELSDPFKAAFRAADSLQKATSNTLLATVSGRMTGSTGPTASAASGQASRPFNQTASGNVVKSQPPTSWGPMPCSGPSRPAGSSGVTPPGPSPAASTAEPNISADFPYASQYLRVLGSRMHYIEQGSGKTILLLHGNPSWSYIWRNIIPHLSSLGRCIAPDLIGFGRSDKPDIRYLWWDHVRYLQGFIEAMDLRDITLVLHDQGSALGFHYAMHNHENVKAIAFFEAIVRPYSWDKFSTPEFREIFRKLRTGGVGGEGWQMIVEQNIFIDQLLPQAAGRQLTEKEMNFYREPFRTTQSRVPIWQFSRQTPIGGEPADVWEAVSNYSERLQSSEIPKLMLYGSPGALLTNEHVAWCKQNINKLESIYIGPGLHFLQESSPHRTGVEIAKWYRNLTSY